MHSICSNIYTFWFAGENHRENVKTNWVTWSIRDHSTVGEDFSMDEKFFSEAIINDQL